MEILNTKDLKARIELALSLQKAFFNQDKVKKDLGFQFIFKETQDEYYYYLGIKNKNCELKDGKLENPACIIETDIDTWEKIGGGYLSGKKAMKQGKLKIDKLFIFLFQYKKIFSGSVQVQLPPSIYIPDNKDIPIKNVLVLSCSPRGEQGATQLFTEKFCQGMEKAGANIDLLVLKKLKINNCLGCFKCWVNNSDKCIFHDKDDMKIILEKMQQSDLLVWATPIYLQHCSNLMKTAMDRLFINVDPHFHLNKNNIPIHPLKKKVPPYRALLAVAGYPFNDDIDPLILTLKRQESARKGSRLLAVIKRDSCMSFLIDEVKNKKKDQVLEAVVKAGMELIENKKVGKKTLRTIEQPVFTRSMFVSAANFFMEKMIQEKRLIYQR